MKFVSYPSHSNRVDSLEELFARAQDLAQRWQDAIDDCASFNLAAVANAAATADEREEDFDLFTAYAAAESNSNYVADIDGLVAAIEAASDDWEEERRQAAVVDLLGSAEDEADLGFSLSLPVAA